MPDGFGPPKKPGDKQVGTVRNEFALRCDVNGITTIQHDPCVGLFTTIYCMLPLMPLSSTRAAQH